MKTMQQFKFLAFVNIFLQTRDRKKKIVLNIEQWNNERKVVWNPSEFVKTFMVTQNKGDGVAYLFSSHFCYRTILKLIVKSGIL